MLQVLSRAQVQVQEKHSMWKYFGRVERKESGSTDVLAKTARLLPRIGLECFPPTELRSFSIWLHSAADHRAHI